MNQEWRQKFLPGVLNIAVICAYLTVIYLYALKVPILDDYHVLENLNQLILAEHPLDVLRLLFVQNNEHRIFTTHVLFYLQYALFHQLNFHALIFFNNILKVILFFFILRLAPRLSYWHYLVAALFFFQLADYELDLWAMAGASTFFVLLFSLLTFWALSRREHYGYFILALLFSFLSIFSNGNGLAVPVVGLLMLWQQRRYCLSGVYLIFFALLIYIYFCWGYSSLSPHLSQPLSSLGYILLSLGGVSDVVLFNVSHSVFKGFFVLGLFMSAVLGVLGLLVFFVFYRRIPGFSKSVLFYYLLFILLSIFMEAVCRGGISVFYGLCPRYKIYSIVFFMVLYLFWSSKSLKPVVHSVSVLMLILVFFNFTYAIYAVRYIQAKIPSMIVECHHSELGGLFYTDGRGSYAQHYIFAVIVQAKNLGVYDYYQYLPATVKVVDLCPTRFEPFTVPMSPLPFDGI